MTRHRPPDVAPVQPRERDEPAGARSGPSMQQWLPILAPPIAWTLAELIGIAIARGICTADSAPDRLAVSQSLALLTLQVAAAAVTAASLFIGIANFRRVSGGKRFAHAEGSNRVQFMAMTGVIISAFLLLNIIYFGIMPVIVDPCLRTT